MTDDVVPDSEQPQLEREKPATTEPEGPAAEALAAEEASRAAASDTFGQAAEDGIEVDDVLETDRAVEPQASGKLERLQKILAQAGVASRRHAEELITQGRVQVNGKVVTELGTKADVARDHIRVDGKLLQGSERVRYLMLNKPRGFVTTVSDPEGRPTIMEFFAKMRERLYPVGRLDYLSEGLLLVTNDGELANKLTRAASGVEKTYLVKVSGQPSEEEIDRLREGVGIERGKPGSGRVQTAPAEIRRVRQGDNPWYEVVLIEGRNRELRKMFEEIGHHVEKIRRVGYGPLVLDLEPGKSRELDAEEVENLRKAAEGKYRKPKAREGRKRTGFSEAQLPPEKRRWNPKRGADARSHHPERGSGSGAERGQSGGQFRTRPRGEFRPGARFGERPPQQPRRENIDRPSSGAPGRGGRFAKSESSERGGRPAWGRKPDRGSRPQFDRNASADKGSQGVNRFRGKDSRSSGGFRPGPNSERGPQRFGEKRPGFAGKRPAPPESGFGGRRKLEIMPAQEPFAGSGADQPRRETRGSFQPPSGGRPHRPSKERFTGKDRNRPQSDRNRTAGARSFDRGESRSFDRPKSGARSGPSGEHRPQRGERSNLEAGRGGDRGPGGKSRKPFVAKPGGGSPGGGSGKRFGGSRWGKPGGNKGKGGRSGSPGGRRGGSGKGRS